ncbi:hypothetical protein [Alloalcanivorax xenomutans]|uniref:hypothetical protein n=1 Tax=Alloalcanivorax xenomutans TaxID=1094342 RepID=UPI003BAD8693
MRFKPSLEELLDEMSAAIAVHLGIEIGKASLDNSPWHNALNAIQEAVASKPAERPMTPERALLHEAKHALTAIALCPRDDSEIDDLFERIDRAEVTACRIADFLFESSNPEAASTREETPHRAGAYGVSEEQLVILPRPSTPLSGLPDAMATPQAAAPEILEAEIPEQDMPGMWSNADLSGGEIDNRDNLLAPPSAGTGLPALVAEWESLARQNAVTARNAASAGKQQDANVSANRAAVFTQCAGQIKATLTAPPLPPAVRRLLDELYGTLERATPPADEPPVSVIESALCSLDEFYRQYGIDTDSTDLPQRTATTAVHDVLAERQRQIEAEGRTPSHDDQHRDSELPRAAYTYLLHTVVQNSGRAHSDELTTTPLTWPWAPRWWKPASPRRNLIKAGALILAEIERLDRAAAQPEQGGRHHGA